MSGCGMTMRANFVEGYTHILGTSQLSVHISRSGFKTPSEAQCCVAGLFDGSSRLRRDCAFSIGLRLALEPDMIEDCQQKKIVCLPLSFKV
jgi:hypothetical protein